MHNTQSHRLLGEEFFERFFGRRFPDQRRDKNEVEKFKESTGVG